MVFITILGDPEDLCNFLASIILAGNDINIVKLTRTNATYLVGYTSTGPATSNFILLENGFYMLLETGDKIIL